MMSKNVTVLEVQLMDIETKSGKVFPGTVLRYQDSDGTAKSMNLFDFILEKNPTLAEKVSSLKPNQKVALHYARDSRGQFNLSDVTEPVVQEAKKFTDGRYKSNFKPRDDLGAQIGGTFHDAVALAIASKTPTVEAVESLAESLLASQARVRAKVSSFSNPSTTESKTSTRPTVKAKAEENDDDLSGEVWEE